MMFKNIFLLFFVTACNLHSITMWEIISGLNAWNARNRQDLINMIKPQQNRSITLIEQEKPFTFDDLAGEISPDVKELVDFIKHPERFNKVGAQMPHGVLLFGPPGTGKTSIARALAGECEAAFFSASGTQFIEVYVGVGPQRIRELFDKARAAIVSGSFKHAFVYIDEIDAIGTSRMLETNSEYRNTLNELLNQMDGFEQNKNITVIASTNTIKTLDPALIRAGRFDRHIEIGLPSEKSREAILRLYAAKIVCDINIDFAELARITIKCSGADLKNLVNEAAILAARANSPVVIQEHFNKAAQKVLDQKKAK